MFGGVESRIAQIVYGVPAVKGVEFGAGLSAANLRGSQNNDDYVISDGQIRTVTNNAGGILGGITTGMPLIFRPFPGSRTRSACRGWRRQSSSSTGGTTPASSPEPFR